MSVSVGDTVRVLSIADETREAAPSYGVSDDTLDSLVGAERNVTATYESNFPMTLIIGAPEDAVWVEAPELPEGVLGLVSGEYEQVAA